MKAKVTFRLAKNRLHAIAPAVRNALAKVVRDTASEIAISAQNLAPVGKREHKVNGKLVQPGYLRSQIHPEPTPNPLVWEVLSEAPYSAWVEYGNSRGAPAQPFLTPAFEAAERTFQSDCAQAIEEAARRAAG